MNHNPFQAIAGDNPVDAICLARAVSVAHTPAEVFACLRYQRHLYLEAGVTISALSNYFSGLGQATTCEFFEIQTFANEFLDIL